MLPLTPSGRCSAHVVVEIGRAGGRSLFMTLLAELNRIGIRYRVVDSNRHNHLPFVGRPLSALPRCSPMRITCRPLETFPFTGPALASPLSAVACYDTFGPTVTCKYPRVWWRLQTAL